MLNKQKGLTLVEMMVVIAIIGILAAIGLPMYQSSVEKTNLSAAKSAIMQVNQRVKDRKLLEPTTSSDQAAIAALPIAEQSKSGEKYIFETHGVADGRIMNIYYQATPRANNANYFLWVDANGHAFKCKGRGTQGNVPTSKPNDCESF